MDNLRLASAAGALKTIQKDADKIFTLEDLGSFLKTNY